MLIKNQQFVVGEVTVKRLTLTEILAAGIDITAPENQHIYQFQAHIQLDLSQPPSSMPPPTTLYFTAAGTPVIPGGTTGPTTGCSDAPPRALTSKTSMAPVLPFVVTSSLPPSA